VTYRSGRHFLQLPGPTNVPDRVLRAMSRPTIDHRGPEFKELTGRLLAELKWLFRTKHHVLVHPSSASGAWEAAITNTLSPGDRVVVFDQGFFAEKWATVADRFGLIVQREPWEPRRGLAAAAVIDALRADHINAIKAVFVVHNETSTGVTSDVEVIGTAMQESEHPAMLFVDAVSSLAATDLQHDAWGIDVTVSGSQKGLMLPPGLAFLAIGPRALEARKAATLPRSYWDWDDQLAANEQGTYPYTPATNLLYGLEEALVMLREEGLANVFQRHARHARAARTAVAAWGLDTFARNPLEASNAVTATVIPDGFDADELRTLILNRYDMSLGTGLGPYKGKLFRIGHLGDFNTLTLMGALAGIEMGLALAGIQHQPGGVRAAMDFLTTEGGGT